MLLCCALGCSGCYLGEWRARPVTSVFPKCPNIGTSLHTLLPHLSLILWPLNRRLVGILSINKNSKFRLFDYLRRWPKI
jgi:hypothetical protein